MKTYKIIKLILWQFITAAGLTPLMAEVIDSSAVGFTIKDTIIIAATPNEVYYSLVTDVGRWWDSAHTFREKQATSPLMIKPVDAFAKN